MGGHQVRKLFEYAVIRFMPFAETQEFANVGIVLWANDYPNTVLIKLAPAPFTRINNFFDDIDGGLYGKARSFMETELERIKHYAKRVDGNELSAVMHELTRKREAVMTFSETGVVLAENGDDILNRLYQTYIGRDLPVTKEQRERLMVRELREQFGSLPFRYKESSVDAGFGKIKIPLVTVIGRDLRAIKPMSFNQAKPMNIADHGDKWISRVGHILDAKAVKAEDFLFTIEAPKSNKHEILMAFDSVKNGMKRLGVQVLPFKNKEKILDFAEPDLSIAPVDFKLT